MQEINRQKCAKIEKNDIMSEVEYWSTAVICGVVGSNPPVEVIDGFVHRIWANKDIDKVVMARKGVFLLRFTNVQDKLVVILRGIYLFDKKPFVLKAWNKGLSLDTSSL